MVYKVIRHLPKLKYCGLTVILSNPSRFDKVNLLSGPANVLFNEHCLRPQYNSMQCDIRVMEDKTPFIEGTKCVLLLGEAALHEWVPFSRRNTLNELRGTVLSCRDIPTIASYFPQDAADSKAYEQTLNPESKEYTIDDDFSDDVDEGDAKSHGNTKRSNYAFWLKSDIGKAKQILNNGVPSSFQPIYKIYPSSSEVINTLTNTKGIYLDLDIETDYEEQNLLCFSFSVDDGKTVYAVPVLDHEYKWAYSSLHYILRALAVAMRDNITVAHNGASFDFFVLASKYGIPVGRAFDTMLAMHRCFPDVEKSLGHCTSFWTWESFHKDEDSRAYRTREHMTEKLKYCAKDVFTMSLVRQAIQQYATRIPGLEASIKCAMDSIRPYLIMTLQGMRYSQESVDFTKKENDRLMMQYLRIINLLIGEHGMAECKRSVKGKAKGFAGSNTQCCNYFHEQLGYPVVARSSKTQKPTLGKSALYKLALKHENPVITFTLMYRILAKEYGTLKFTPWKNNDNQIVKPTNTEQQDKTIEHGGSFLAGLSSTINSGWRR